MQVRTVLRVCRNYSLGNIQRMNGALPLRTYSKPSPSGRHGFIVPTLCGRTADGARTAAAAEDSSMATTQAWTERTELVKKAQ
jgi:hypothetical protein